MNIMDVFTRLDLCKCTHSGRVSFTNYLCSNYFVSVCGNRIYCDAAAEECTKSGWTYANCFTFRFFNSYAEFGKSPQASITEHG